jgi:ribulose-5-phosphate 4-epimerase/fuculose-1-phosphate aldolase
MSEDGAAWWYITMERNSRTQLLANTAGTPLPPLHEVALSTRAPSILRRILWAVPAR